MDAIEIMIEEHENIKRMLRIIRVMCIKVLDNRDIDYNDFYKVIDFVQSYADRLHHGKEEKVLFKQMGNVLGERVAKGPIAGMLIEHDFGRLYMKNLEKALEEYLNGYNNSRVDIIANSIGYAELLNRHIDKENTVIYTFARRQLRKEVIEEINEECINIEKGEEVNELKEKYLSLLDKFEKRYL